MNIAAAAAIELRVLLHEDCYCCMNHMLSLLHVITAVVLLLPSLLLLPSVVVR